MHIAIVAPEALPVPPLKGGSVEICIHAIARQLAKEHKVTVIGRRHPRLPVLERDGPVTYVRVKANSSAVYLKAVISELRKGSFDMIQVDNRPKYAAAIKKALPHQKIALFLHSLTFVTPPRLSPSAAAALLGKPDLIIANSTSLFGELSRRYPVSRKKLRKVWLGVDVERFRKPTPEERRKLRREYRVNGAYTVLFVGRVIPRKGVPVLIRAVKQMRKQVPGAKLIVAGGGKATYVGKLKRLAARLGVPVRFTGLISHRTIHRLYRAADCFVCPSQKHEAFGLVNVEAMASGLPVVGSNIGGIGEIVVNGKNGYLVDRFREPGEFADCLVRLAKEPSLAKRMSEQARSDAVMKFGWGATARKLGMIYGRGSISQALLRTREVSAAGEDPAYEANAGAEDVLVWDEALSEPDGQSAKPGDEQVATVAGIWDSAVMPPRALDPKREDEGGEQEDELQEGHREKKANDSV
ncbi:glycosyltransferase family 4 protein [Paenibacillus chartarius]|uniref:Glycosyltransferase family 4 protein n=1 Tax=Paenibacillus chartarius TaxID=747481 RepID=A0ABV6DRK0_9BACL